MTEEQQQEQESPLKKRREELGLTQRDVAGAVDVSVQTISNWETGRYRGARLTLPQVKSTLSGITVEYRRYFFNYVPISGFDISKAFSPQSVKLSYQPGV